MFCWLGESGVNDQAVDLFGAQGHNNLVEAGTGKCKRHSISGRQHCRRTLLLLRASYRKMCMVMHYIGREMDSSH